MIRSRDGETHVVVTRFAFLTILDRGTPDVLWASCARFALRVLRISRWFDPIVRVTRWCTAIAVGVVCGVIDLRLLRVNGYDHCLERPHWITMLVGDDFFLTAAHDCEVLTLEGNDREATFAGSARKYVLYVHVLKVRW